MPPIVLLGPQRLQRTLGTVVLAAGVEGDFAAVTAGWEEREDEIDELRAHLDRRIVNLRLYARSEEVFRTDPEFAEAFRERRRRLRELSDLHKIRLDHARRATRKLFRTEGDLDLLEPERAGALDDLRRLDEHQRRRIDQLDAEFDEDWRPAERDAIAAHRREVAELLSACSALAIAGGNVATLIHRLRLFAVESHVRHLAVFAWSAGAMACAEEIVLFHDDPPQGAGHPEVFGAGLGLVPDVLPLPHATRRLRLDDKMRVSAFARRFAPRVCVAMDRGHGMIWERGVWTSVAGGARRLTEGGEVVEMFAP